MTTPKTRKAAEMPDPGTPEEASGEQQEAAPAETAETAETAEGQPEAEPQQDASGGDDPEPEPGPAAAEEAEMVVDRRESQDAATLRAHPDLAYLFTTTPDVPPVMYLFSDAEREKWPSVYQVRDQVSAALQEIDGDHQEAYRRAHTRKPAPVLQSAVMMP